MTMRTTARARGEARNRRWVVDIEYRDGKSITTFPLSQDHANDHARTVRTYPTVKAATVRELPKQE